MIRFKRQIIFKGENIMKNQKGITLIALVVTIIILLIIASVATYTGINSIQDSKNQSYISEVKMLQQVVLENYTKYLTTKDEKYLRGEPLNYSNMKDLVSNINSNSNETITLKMLDYGSVTASTESIYYYRLSENDLKEMEVSVVDGDAYIVNYYTGEVFNETLKVTGDGVPLYIYATDVEIPDIIISANPSSNTSEVSSQNIVISVQSQYTISELKYKWTELLNEPDKDQFTDIVPSNNNITSPSGGNGNYYLWIYAKDVNGNEVISSFGGYKLSNL